MTTQFRSRTERPPARTEAEELPPLHPGDHLDQPTFHRLYEAMPEDFKAELIGGVVIMPYPATMEHSGGHSSVSGWLFTYEAATPGTRSLSEPTVILGPRSEPQPDGVLVIEPESGGQIRIVGSFLTGPPELVVEVAYTSYAQDLNSKKRDYEAAGVREYVVVLIRQQRVEWFALREGKFEPHPPGPDGILRSEIFPGLWLDPSALAARDVARVLLVLQQGLATPEHAAFVQQLQQRRGPSPPG
ncbi:Uma2 family endonuclease [soil metagenome]